MVKMEAEAVVNRPDVEMKDVNCAAIFLECRR
jgi:hypothetical protein